MIFGLFRSRVMAGIVCVCLCFGLAYWFAAGTSGRTTVAPQRAAEKAIQQITDELTRRNPEAAAELAKIRETRDHVALAATLKEREQLQGLDGLVRLAEAHKDAANAQNMYDLRLAEFAVSPRFVNQQQRSDFILTHGIGLEKQYALASRLGVPAAHSPINDYFQTLEFATHDDNLWSRVRDNPMMVFLMQQNVDQELLDFYESEKEGDWVDDVLFWVCSHANAAEESELLTPQEVLHTLWQNHPYFKEALNDTLAHRDNDVETTVCVLYSLFANDGEVLRHCLRKGQIPIAELLDVFFANVDYFDKHTDSRPEELAATLITLRNRHPAVWNAARQRPLCLELYERIPHLADTLCEHYGQDDIALFLLSKYDEMLPAAAAAIDKFGDLAIYILNRYENSEIFRQALKDNNLGVRIIPYTARFEDSGLERMHANQAWLDRYFDKEGHPKEQEWWVDIPGGAVVNVARNWANGLPNEWSELGWAAVDVGTAVMFVGTMGGSVTVTTAARTGTIAAGKVGSKTVSRAALTTVARNATARAATTLRTTSRQGVPSLFRQALVRTTGTTQFSLVSRMVGGTAKILWLPVQLTVNAAKTIGTMTYANVLRLRSGWAGLPAAMRQNICRGLFVAGLSTIILCRTVPMVSDVLQQLGADGIGSLLAAGIQELGKTVAGVLDGCLQELLHPLGVSDGVGRWIRYGLVALVFVGLIGLTGRRAFLPARARVTKI